MSSFGVGLMMSIIFGLALLIAVLGAIYVADIERLYRDDVDE